MDIQRWDENIAMNFQICRWETKAEDISGMMVKLSGRFQVPGQNRKGAQFVTMVAAAALAWDPGDGLIFDLTDLECTGGEGLTQWEDLLDDFDPYPFAYYCSDSNFETVRDLFDSEGRPELKTAVFKDFEAAAQAIARRAS